MRKTFVFALAVIVAGGLSLIPARAQELKQQKLKVEIEVPFVPTNEKVVAAMLKLADVKEGDTVYDLGCGDGRIVIAAVKDFKAKKGLGMDFNPERLKDCEAPEWTRTSSPSAEEDDHLQAGRRAEDDPRGLQGRGRGHAVPAARRSTAAQAGPQEGAQARCRGSCRTTSTWATTGRRTRRRKSSRPRTPHGLPVDDQERSRFARLTPGVSGPSPWTAETRLAYARPVRSSLSIS